MTPKMTGKTKTIVLTALFAAATAAAENQDGAAATSVLAEPAATLAETAHTVAVEEAIEAVLAENRIELDSHFTGRTSIPIVDGP